MWSGVRNVRSVRLWVAMRTSKCSGGVFETDSFIHVDNVCKKSTKGIQCMEKYNVKRAWCVSVQLEREGNIAFIVLMFEPMGPN